jgi:hypothetical protein
MGEPSNKHGREEEMHAGFWHENFKGKDYL